MVIPTIRFCCRIMAMMTVDNILAALNGSVPPNCVNAGRLTWA